MLYRCRVEYYDTFNLQVRNWEKCRYFFRLIQFDSVFFRLKMTSVVGFKSVVMFFLISHLQKGWVSRIVLYWFNCYGEVHLKLNYTHKSNFYSQCSRSMNKGIATLNMNSSSSKEFELNIKLLNLTWFSLTTIRRTYQHFPAPLNKNNSYTPHPCWLSDKCNHIKCYL